MSCCGGQQCGKPTLLGGTSDEKDATSDIQEILDQVIIIRIVFI